MSLYLFFPILIRSTSSYSFFNCFFKTEFFFEYFFRKMLCLWMLCARNFPINKIQNIFKPICMIQLVWPTIGFQIFIAFTLSYKLFIQSSRKLFLQSIQPSKVQSKWFQNKLQYQQLLHYFPRKTSQGKREKKKSPCETLALRKKKLRILWNSACRTAFKRQI